MKINEFINILNEFSPNVDELIDFGFTANVANDVIKNEFLLKTKKNFDSSNDELSLMSFLRDFDIEKFRVFNLSFSDVLRYVGTYLIVGNIDGGLLVKNDGEETIRIMFADDKNNVHQVFCENDDQFFQLLLIIAEYSSKSYKGELEEDAIEEYVERCEEICQLGSFDIFF